MFVIVFFLSNQEKIAKHQNLIQKLVAKKRRLAQKKLTDLLRKICEVVAEVARNLIDNNGSNPWPEFLHFPFQSGSAPTVQFQESAQRIFSSVPGIFSNQQDQHLQPDKQMLVK